MRRSFKIAVILFLFSTSGLWAQQLASPYAVSFIPKSVLIDTLNPSSILSNRAVERRSKQGIELSKTDVPIQRTYLSKIKSIVSHKGPASKWLNMLYIEATPDELVQLMSLDFVESIIPIRGGMSQQEIIELPYGYSESQTKQISLHSLHVHSDNGYD